MTDRYFHPDWTAPLTVAWTPTEHALTQGMPYPVAKGFIDRRRQDHPPSYTDLFGGRLGSIFG